jgi:hypothetical protein
MFLPVEKMDGFRKTQGTAGGLFVRNISGVCDDGASGQWKRWTFGFVGDHGWWNSRCGFSAYSPAASDIELPVDDGD